MFSPLPYSFPFFFKLEGEIKQVLLSRPCSFPLFSILMTFGRLCCVMLDWFYCCLFPVGNSWHCSLFSIDIHFQQYCFLLDSCTVCAKQTEYLLGWPQSAQINKHRNKQNNAFLRSQCFQLFLSKSLFLSAPGTADERILYCHLC